MIQIILSGGCLSTYLNKIRTIFHQLIKRVASVDVSTDISPAEINKKQKNTQIPSIQSPIASVGVFVCERTFYIIRETFAVSLFRFTLSAPQHVNLFKSDTNAKRKI